MYETILRLLYDPLYGLSLRWAIKSNTAFLTTLNHEQFWWLNIKPRYTQHDASVDDCISFEVLF